MEPHRGDRIISYSWGVKGEGSFPSEVGGVVFFDPIAVNPSVILTLEGSSQLNSVLEPGLLQSHEVLQRLSLTVCEESML
jgi:hypothetical protein